MIHYKMFVLGMGSFSLKERGDRPLPAAPLYPFFLSPGNMEKGFFSIPPLYPQVPQDESYGKAEGGGMEKLPTYTPILKGRRSH